MCPTYTICYFYDKTFYTYNITIRSCCNRSFKISKRSDVVDILYSKYCFHACIVTDWNRDGWNNGWENIWDRDWNNGGWTPWWLD